MTQDHIHRTAKSLKDQVWKERRVVWSWQRWRIWTRDEIEQLAEMAGVCFASDGEGTDLRFFEWA